MGHGRLATVLGRCSIVYVLAAAPCALVACSSPAPDADDPCADRSVVAGGSVELGLGDTFTPVTNGEDATLVLGAQGLWMFVVNARVQDMAADAGQLGLFVDAVDASGGRASLLARTCRARGFADDGSGALALTSGTLMPLDLNAEPMLDGTSFTIRVEVRDVDGHQATDQRTVVAHLP